MVSNHPGTQGRNVRFQGGNGVFNKYFFVRSFGEKGFGKMNDWLEKSLVRYNVLKYMIIVL